MDSTSSLAYDAAAASPRQRSRAVWQGPAPLVIGWLALFGPIYADLARSLWREDVHAHGPLIGLVVAALLWHQRAGLSQLSSPASALSGVTLLAGGLLLVVISRVADIPALAMFGQIPVLSGLLLACGGRAALVSAWFPLAFLMFMIPLPGIVIDAVTQPLKEWISMATAEVLHGVGYPVARSGVVLTVGQYQLLIVDACSGLHSFVSMLALGALYTHMSPGAGAGRRAGLLAVVVPIALAANLLRVIVLALVTYHTGDAAGRLWHEAAGLVMFAVALGGLVATDALLSRLGQRRRA